jgi:phosphatidylglycerophosphate synthase
VGWGNVICLVIEYDAKVVIILLMIIFDVLIPTIQTFATQVDGSYVEAIVVEEKDNNIFGVLLKSLLLLLL